MTTGIVQKHSNEEVNAPVRAGLAAASQPPLADCSYRLSTPGAAARELTARRALQEALAVARTHELAGIMKVKLP